MKHLITILTVILAMASVSRAGGVQVEFASGSILSEQDKSAITNYLDKNCVRLTRAIEFGSREENSSAPENSLKTRVFSVFEVSYLVDDPHPRSGYLTLEILKEKKADDSSTSTSKIVGSQGLEDNCSAPL